MSRAQKELGLFGGSFNPIHLGHLHLAQAVHEALALDGVMLMPTGEAPHKDCSGYAPAAHRLAMCRLAVKKFPWMTVCDDEIRKSGKSYTVETLRELCLTYPDAHWTLMIGSDMLLCFEAWRDWRAILHMARICAVSRAQGDLPALRDHARRLQESEPGAEIMVLPIAAFPASSTEIRENLQKNVISSCLLPENVVEYIKEHGLYRTCC